MPSTCIGSIKSLRITLRMSIKGITLVSTGNLTPTISTQQQQHNPKTKEKLNMVSPPGFNSFIVNELHQDVQNFQGGNLRYFSKNWHKYTKDTYTIDIVTNGLKLELNELPCQYTKIPSPIILYQPKRRKPFLTKSINDSKWWWSVNLYNYTSVIYNWKGKTLVFLDQ